MAATSVYSVVATVAPGVFPASFVSMGRVSVCFEAAAAIISLTLLGRRLELKARSQTSATIKSLLGLAPKTSRPTSADRIEEDVPLTHVHVRDALRVRPGKNIHVDGSVLEGSSAGDEPMLTGKPMPVSKRPGDKLISGTMNTTGALGGVVVLFVRVWTRRLLQALLDDGKWSARMYPACLEGSLRMPAAVRAGQDLGHGPMERRRRLCDDDAALGQHAAHLVDDDRSLMDQ